MQNFIKISLFFTILQLSFFVNAQEISKTDSVKTEELIYKIHVLAKVTDTEIILRWAPDNPIAWYYANKYGYTIERHTIIRDGKQLIPSGKKVLTKEIKPANEDKWAKAEKNKYNAIAWQAIFGEKFEVINTQNEMLKIKDKANVLTSRFSLTLFSCDRSAETAELSGLLFKDKNIKKNEKYLYRIYTNIPAEIAKVDTGAYFVDAGKITEYPKPIELSAEFKDKIVNLTWNQMYYKGIYSAWSVERSTDAGQTFIRINESPIVNLHYKDKDVKYMHYTDSLPENNKKYIYRIIGHSPFGDEGPPSDTVSGFGVEVLKTAPFFTKTLINEKGEVILSWDYPENYNSKIEGFKILTAPKDKGIYKAVHKNIISPEDRMYIDKKPKTTAYYKIYAIDKHGKEYKSQASLVQLIDTVPPKPPAGLKGIIDSTGTVIVSWNPNTEDDFSGYRVYMTNHLNSEFTQITKKAIKDTTFRFKTTLKTLTKNMYLKVMAEDNRFNPSKFSNIIKVTRPDTIPPSSPVIKNFKVTDSCIYLQWVRSTSKDVVNHIVFRSPDKKEEWEAIAVFDTVYNPDSYCDTSATPGILYKYIVIAVDDSDNKSKKIKPVRLQMSKKRTAEKIKNFKAEINKETKQIEISWSLPDKAIKMIYLYRKIGEGKTRMYKRFDDAVTKFADTDIQINTKYEYQLRIIFADGKSSPFSKKAIVNY